MTPEQLQRLKGLLRRVWILSPERLWLASIALHRRGHWILAFALKQVNGFLYHNSLAPAASVSPDVFLGHNSLGIVINRNVEIGRRVVIWHNVTLAAGRPERMARGDGRADAPAGSDDTVGARRGRIVVEDDVKIGSNAVVIAPRSETLRIGRGARIGAGTVVTKDVPPRARVVGAAPRTLEAAEGNGTTNDNGRDARSAGEAREPPA